MVHTLLASLESVTTHPFLQIEAFVKDEHDHLHVDLLKPQSYKIYGDIIVDQVKQGFIEMIRASLETIQFTKRAVLQDLSKVFDPLEVLTSHHLSKIIHASTLAAQIEL